MSPALPLDSEIWSELTHAYGKAGDIPDLLVELRSKDELGGPNDEPMFTLWSSLYHQEDVYSASFAAFPHLIEIAQTKIGKSRNDILMLASAIASGVDDPKPLLRPETEAAFLAARPRALNMMCDAFKGCDGADIQYWLGSLAALKGKNAVARTLFSFDSVIGAAVESKAQFPFEDALFRELEA